MGTQGVTSGKLIVLGAAVAAAFALLPAAAGASTKIGASDAEMNFQPTSFCSATLGNPCSWVTQKRVGGVSETAPTAPSVLTSVRIRTRMGGATLSVRVLHNTAISTYANSAETSFDVTPDASLSGHITEKTGLRMPMAAGDLLGVGYVRTGDEVYMASATGGEVCRKADAAQPLGASLFYGGGCSVAILIQGTIEPDADQDGFGDETQDRCLTKADLKKRAGQPGCAAKKCKKKGKKRLAEASKKKNKKKCKKRKRKGSKS